jgi:purine-binding chemotaxis protein CheW
MQVLTFQYGQENYCMDIDEVSSVLQDVAILALPRAPTPFEGIFQLRGRVITLFNFERYLGEPESEGDSQIIVFADPRSHFAMRVPGLIESKTLGSEPREITGRETRVSPFLKAIVYDGEEIYHLLSASAIFFRAGEVTGSREPEPAGNPASTVNKREEPIES